MKKYKQSLLLAIFISLTERIILCGIMLSGIFFFFDKTGDLSNITSLIFFLIITLTIFRIIYAYKNRLVITENEIILIRLFSTKKLKINEIKGYREVSVNGMTHGDYMFVEPNDSNKKGIRITDALNGSDEILDWLSERFPDLDKEEGKQDLKKF